MCEHADNRHDATDSSEPGIWNSEEKTLSGCEKCMFVTRSEDEPSEGLAAWGMNDEYVQPLCDTRKDA